MEGHNEGLGVSVTMETEIYHVNSLQITFMT